MRSVLHRAGYRFRLHRKDLPGKPDIVIPKHLVAVFVHGCFWHSHRCRFGKVKPSTRAEFWANKRNATVERDLKKAKALVDLGWKVTVIWECEVADSKNILRAIKARISL